MQRPDLRHISGNIREALEGCDRDTLLDILTFVFKEYLVEGPPPLLVHQTERIEDLQGLSFAELIATLQTRLDVPELGLFQVDGNTVSVRAGGALTPLTAQGRGQASPASQPEPRPAPGVRVVETDFVRRPPPAGAQSERSSVSEAVARGRHDLAGMAQDMVNDAMRAEGSAPPPRRGLSIQGRTTGGAMMPASPGPSRAPAAPPREAPAQASQNPGPAQGQGQGQGQAQNPPASAQSPASEPAAPDDSASARFSLLELD